ncbi:MAG: ATP-dependent DNA helicase RecG, partial [Candidatus Omnitrophota bacterium]
IELDMPVQYFQGVGPKRAKFFNKLGIYTAEDILYYFPRRYEDRSNFLPISKLQAGKVQTIRGKVLKIDARQSWKRRRFNIFQVIVEDSTGKIPCVWFNQPYLKNYLKLGQNLILYGRVQEYSGRLQINSPEFEIASEDRASSLDIGRITPVYTLSEGLTQRYFRQILKRSLDDCLPRVADALSYDIRTRNDLLNFAKSLHDIHFPDDLNQSKAAYRRLAFEEFFLFQVLIYLRKLTKKQRPGIRHKVTGQLSEKFENSIPFKLTLAQVRVIQEIKQDMALPLSMNRLLQGDVGSGKTIVAIFAALFAIQGGYQVAFMVPTELLAQQHYATISSQFLALRFQERMIKLGLLSGSATQKEKSKIYQEIKEGKMDLIIGTHALLEQEVGFKSLGLVIIDEQHKFGVSQRAQLRQRGTNPDILVMTATPIPRTLAITLYGDLDISVINELPPLRRPVRTRLVTKNKRQEVYRFIKQTIDQGQQVYIVYPIIDESGVLDLQAASQMYDILKKDIFPQFNIGLIHGQLTTKQQNEIMSRFRRGTVNILVATTVLEVGIDVPNASLMIIEHAERFGLSQLHQLRGRIGRGGHESDCILISEPQTNEAKLRIKAMVENSDGFHIAEEDLRIRGPGEFFGQRQHGLSELRIANPLTQLQLLKRARTEAGNLINRDPNLKLRQNLLLGKKIKQRFPDYEKYITVG